MVVYKVKLAAVSLLLLGGAVTAAGITARSFSRADEIGKPESQQSPEAARAALGATGHPANAPLAAAPASRRRRYASWSAIPTANRSPTRVFLHRLDS